MNALRARRHEPPRKPTDEEIAAAVATTPDFPVFNISKKNFDRQFCKCLRHREAGKCDCKLCAYIQWNTAAFHKARGKWDVAERCEEGTCSACTPGSAYREASRSPEHMMAFLLCPKCRPCDIQPNGFPPRVPTTSTSSSAPAANSTFVNSTSHQHSTACEAEPVAAAPSPVEKATAVDAAADELVGTGGSRESTRKRQRASDPSPLLPAFASSVAPGDGQATPRSSADATAISVPDAPADTDAPAGPEVLVMRGAVLPFMVYAPTCVNGSHQSFSFGGFVYVSMCT